MSEFTFDMTIGEADRDIRVTFDYIPAEPMIANPVEICHPGCPAEVEVLEVDDEIGTLLDVYRESKTWKGIIDDACHAHIDNMEPEGE